jgi:thiamine biosynthesis lipoprotein
MQYTQKTLQGNKKLFYAWFSAMFTRVDIAFYDDNSSENLVRIVERIESEISKIEAFANRFDPNSELSSVNENAFNKELTVSAELFEILTECLDYNTKTFGYFDNTVNSQNGFRNGAKAVLLNEKNISVSFLHPDVRIDLSGFIKGYALRSVMEILITENIENALISIGNSSVFAKGNHPFGRGWKVAVPDTTNECVLYNECLTTSGNKEHTKWCVLNPITGDVPMKQAVSVITADPAVGEVLSTVAYIAENETSALIFQEFDAKVLT